MVYVDHWPRNGFVDAPRYSNNADLWTILPFFSSFDPYIRNTQRYVRTAVSELDSNSKWLSPVTCIIRPAVRGLKLSTNCIRPGLNPLVTASGAHADNYGIPPDPFVIHVDETPISVQFSRYKTPIPYPALIRTYRQIWDEVHPRGYVAIGRSEIWDLEATVRLWPMRNTMTWEMFAFALEAMGEFARTQGQEGFRFDVYSLNTLVGLGAVTDSASKAISARSSRDRAMGR